MGDSPSSGAGAAAGSGRVLPIVALRADPRFTAFERELVMQSKGELGWTDAPKLALEVLRFLMLCVRHEGANLVPSPQVHEAWAVLMHLQPLYSLVCACVRVAADSRGGAASSEQVVAHDYARMRVPPSKIAARYERTTLLYSQHYCVEPPASYWPHAYPVAALDAALPSCSPLPHLASARKRAGDRSAAAAASSLGEYADSGGAGAQSQSRDRRGGGSAAAAATGGKSGLSLVLRGGGGGSSTAADAAVAAAAAAAAAAVVEAWGAGGGAGASPAAGGLASAESIQVWMGADAAAAAGPDGAAAESSAAAAAELTSAAAAGPSSAAVAAPPSASDGIETRGGGRSKAAAASGAKLKTRSEAPPQRDVPAPAAVADDGASAAPAAASSRKRSRGVPTLQERLADAASSSAPWTHGMSRYVGVVHRPLAGNAEPWTLWSCVNDPTAHSFKRFPSRELAEGALIAELAACGLPPETLHRRGWSIAREQEAALEAEEDEEGEGEGAGGDGDGEAGEAVEGAHGGEDGSRADAVPVLAK